MVAKEIMPRAYNRGRTSPSSSFFCAKHCQYERLKAYWNEAAVAQASAILRGNTAAVMWNKWSAEGDKKGFIAKFWSICKNTEKNTDCELKDSGQFYLFLPR